jgi:hypothetical protein
VIEEIKEEYRELEVKIKDVTDGIEVDHKE